MNTMTICLNMIVKDEEDIIVETLTNIVEKMNIHYWVICDTGSTDSTAQLVTDFFKEKDISGELIHDKWVDFAHNRTKALDHAFKKTDFVFIFDADDRIVGELVLPNLERGHAYRMQFGWGVQWKRMPLLDNHIKWYYEGVMHEIIVTKEEYKTKIIEGDYHIATNVVVSARNKKGPDKYFDDALVLVRAYEKRDHLYPRYSFYAGECFRFSGKENWQKSMEWYKKSANEVKSWAQERYWSCYQIGKMYGELGEKEKSWYWLFKSYEFDNSRQEAFFELIIECRKTNKFEMAHGLYKMLKPCTGSKLFIINHIYEHSLLSEMFIVLYYLKKIEETTAVLKKLLLAEKPLEAYVNITNSNLTYFIPHLKKDDWEFYAKFQAYSRKFNVPNELKNQIDAVFKR